MRHSHKEALSIANAFIKKYVSGEYVIAGSIRRNEPTIGDIDIMTSDPLGVIEQKLGDDAIKIRGKSKKLDVDFKGMRINIYFATSLYWGAMLFFLTGPRSYEIAYRVKAKKKGWKLDQYGLWDKDDNVIASRTETSIYKALGKSYKQPELRGRK